MENASLFIQEVDIQAELLPCEHSLAPDGAGPGEVLLNAADALRRTIHPKDATPQGGRGYSATAFGLASCLVKRRFKHPWIAEHAPEELAVLLDSLVRCRIRDWELTVHGHNNRLVFERGVHAENLRVTIQGDNNRIEFRRGVRLHNCTISIEGNNDAGNFQARDNRIIIGTGADLTGLQVSVVGVHQRLEVGERVWAGESLKCRLRGAGCGILIGPGTSIQSAVLSAAEIETAINIGPDCMFAHGVEIRTSDDHPLLEEHSLRRINSAQSITIGKHVWLMADAKVFKGARIGDGCAVGSRALVIAANQRGRSTLQEVARAENNRNGELHNAILAGAPAQVKRTGVLWARGLIYDETSPEEENPRYADVYAESWFYRACLFDERGQYEPAVYACDRAIRLKPDYAYAHKVRADALAKIGNQGEAMQGYQKALAIMPDYTDARESLNHLRRNIPVARSLNEDCTAATCYVQVQPSQA